MVPVEEQLKIIAKGAEEIIDRGELEGKLRRAQESGRPLIVKLGLDPSAPDIHLGHTVVLRKIRQFQDLGHRAVIIIGDFTGMIGDPTGKSKTRKQLSRSEVAENAKTYEEQIFKILLRDKTELRFNSEWLSGLGFEDVVRLAAKSTVARMLEREEFRKRFESNESIGIHEFFYPLMQGYDSVELHADIELGGTEQRFNILMGRKLQKDYGQESQVALFMPILEGLDGVDKMSKSLGNYVGINEDPDSMYGKLMSIPDGLIIRYFRLVTDIHPDELDEMERQLGSGSVNPRDLKMKLSREVTALYHGEEKAYLAEERFRALFQKHELPDGLMEFTLDGSLIVDGKTDIVSLLVQLGFAASKSEARRLVSQGAVRINGEKAADLFAPAMKAGDIIQAGKLKFAKLMC
jgi:tyrosyl-tRNA synthetase